MSARVLQKGLRGLRALRSRKPHNSELPTRNSELGVDTVLPTVDNSPSMAARGQQRDYYDVVQHEDAVLLPDVEDPDFVDSGLELAEWVHENADSSEEAAGILRGLSRDRARNSTKRRKYVANVHYCDVSQAGIRVPPDRDAHIVVRHPDGAASTIKVVRLGADHAAPAAAARLGSAVCHERHWNSMRRQLVGGMVSLGVRRENLGSGQPPVPYNVSLGKNCTRSCKHEDICILQEAAACELGNVIRRHFPEAVVDMNAAMAAKGKCGRGLPILGGHGTGLSTYAIISVNLANESHVDILDKSISVGVWAERHIGRAKNWCLVFPGLGDAGLVIELSHGTAIQWDGRSVHHCSSIPDRGQKNDVFGFLTVVK